MSATYRVRATMWILGFRCRATAIPRFSSRCDAMAKTIIRARLIPIRSSTSPRVMYVSASVKRPRKKTISMLGNRRPASLTITLMTLHQNAPMAMCRSPGETREREGNGAEVTERGTGGRSRI